MKRAKYRVVREGCEVAIDDGGSIRYYKFSDPYTATIFVYMIDKRPKRKQGGRDATYVSV